jgi:hypothetical protein
MPPRPDDSAVQLALAAEELVASADSGRTHDVDVVFGTRIVELLDQAQTQINAGRVDR